MRVRRWAVAIAVMAGPALLFACSSKGSSEPRRPLDTSPASAGAVVVSDDAGGFALSLPPSWVKMPIDSASFPAAADAVRGQAPPAAAAAVAIGLVQLKSAVLAGVIMAAIDPTTGSTANLVALNANGQNVSQVSIGAANRLIGNGATDLTRTTVTADGLPAARSKFRNAFSGDSGPVNLNESQLYVVRRGQAFILTLTGDSADLDAIASSLKLA